MNAFICECMIDMLYFWHMERNAHFWISLTVFVQRVCVCVCRHFIWFFFFLSFCSSLLLQIWSQNNPGITARMNRVPDVSEIVPYAGITIRAHTGNECAAEFIKKAKNRNIQRAPHLGRNIYYHRDGIFWGSYHHITVTIFFFAWKKKMEWLEDYWRSFKLASETFLRL